MADDTKTMERVRDLQAEIGAVLDRFHSKGLSAASILEVMSAETEIWLSRTARADAATERETTEL